MELRIGGAGHEPLRRRGNSLPSPYQRPLALDNTPIPSSPRTVTGVSEVRNAVSCDDGGASFGPPGQAVRSGR